MNHDKCKPESYCAVAGCPARAAHFRRSAGLQGTWSELRPVFEKRHELDGRIVPYGTILLLQERVWARDEYGEYPTVLDRGVAVAYNIDVNGSVLLSIISAGSYQFRSVLQPGMRFQWPRS